MSHKPSLRYTPGYHTGAWLRRWMAQPLGYWRSVLLVVLVLSTCLACSTRGLGEPVAESAAPLPEVKQILFTGNTHFSSSTLRDEMATKQAPLLPPWGEGDPYNPPTVAEDLLRLQKFYFDRGFLDTTVTLVNVQEDPQKRSVRLTIHLDEGLPTVVTAVHLAGTVPSALPSAQELLKALPLRPTERLNKEDFTRSKDLLLAHLHNASYARAEVVPQTEVDPQTHTAIVTFTLYPGEHTAFGETTIAGAHKVEENAIRRQLLFDRGQPYKATAVSDSADAIYRMGMFQAVTPRLVNLEEADTPLEVRFEVRERTPRTIQVGFGFSTVERFRLQVAWLHRNLFGGAESLSLETKASSIEQAFKARLQLPYFLYRRTSFTQTLFVRNEQDISTDPLGLSDSLFAIKEAQPAFDLFSAGGEARVEHQMTQRLRLAIGLMLSRNDFSNVDPRTLQAAGLGSAEDNLLFTQFVEAHWDTRDSLLNATRGLLVRGRLEHANTGLLSDVSFGKLLWEFRHYQQVWWEMVLATRLKIGTVQPYGSSDDVPFNVRFFAGGPGSVRGFALNRLGPQDEADNPLGGNSLIEGGAELRFPLFGSLSGALFVDFGNVFRSAFTYRLDELRYAGGPGVRYDTPIGAIRLDVGFIFDRRTGENFGRVEFSIGQAF